MLICAVEFKRTRLDTEWEQGIGFSRCHNEMELDTIVDAMGNRVSELWGFRLQLLRMSFIIDMTGR